MERAFNNAGWGDFHPVHEQGSQLLTIEFLMSLRLDVVDQKTLICFRLFNEEYCLAPRDLSNALGFHKRCCLYADTLVTSHRYDRASWWDSISGEPPSGKNSITAIHNPTLRFLAKWIAMVVHPRADIRLCLTADVDCLFAMVNKIKYSPVMTMVEVWQRMVTTRATIDITSLVTRLATRIGALDGAQITYLSTSPEYQSCIGLDHFVQGHLLREGPNNRLFMCYPGFHDEIELPCPELALKKVKSLTLQLRRKEPPRRSVAGPATRRRDTRNDDEAGPSEPHQQYQHHSTAHMAFNDMYNYFESVNRGEQPQPQPQPQPVPQPQPHPSQAGPSSSARYGYENSALRELADIRARMEAMGLQQDEIQENLGHNTDLTQQNWGMTSSVHHDLQGFFDYMGYYPGNPYQ